MLTAIIITIYYHWRDRTISISARFCLWLTAATALYIHTPAHASYPPIYSTILTIGSLRYLQFRVPSDCIIAGGHGVRHYHT
ncbi:hypothetical protein GGS20DRAFT_396176 [Poronia punctata]|nr:hypothetical protein GGS20DRAFT_396176 [Poronia punctata]